MVHKYLNLLEDLLRVFNKLICLFVFTLFTVPALLGISDVSADIPEADPPGKPPDFPPEPPELPPEPPDILCGGNYIAYAQTTQGVL